jgi:hypothetical protein
MRLILRYPEHDGIVLGIIGGTKQDGKKKESSQNQTEDRLPLSR